MIQATTRDYGTLCDYQTDADIRPATLLAALESQRQALRDGGAGAIAVTVEYYRLYDGGVSRIEYAHPGDGPEHDDDADSCDCYDCNGTQIIAESGLRTCYVSGVLTYDDVETIAAEYGLDLAHDCDQDARECALRETPHAPGDNRCPNRAQHTPCTHDLDKLIEALS